MKLLKVGLPSVLLVIALAAVVRLPSRSDVTLRTAAPGTEGAAVTCYLPLALHGTIPELADATAAPPAGASATAGAAATQGATAAASETASSQATLTATPQPAATATVGAAATAEGCVPSKFQGTVDLSHLPMGDPLVLRRDQGARQPAVGALWLCGVPQGGRGNDDASDWANPDGSWDFQRKPTVDGRVPFASIFQVTLDGLGNRLITGNALPSTPAGVFPIDPGSIAYRYDRNPSHIEPHDVNLRLSALPQPAAAPRCVTYGASGISLTGNAIYHGASTLGNDAAAHEMLDAFGGQSDGTTTYHTHFLTDELLDRLDTCEPGHSALMGYILDGFGIYGPRGEDGKILGSKDLDACHGHTHPVLWDGKMVNLYHYHWTYDFPYNVGCFKGTPVKAWN